MLDLKEHKQSAGPSRSCAGCRRKDAQRALLRFAVGASEPVLVPDPRHRLSGRGVSVHPNRDCLRLAVEKGGFSRALRRNVRLDLDEVCGLVLGQYERRLEGLMLAARRKGQMICGTDAVTRVLDSGRCSMSREARRRPTPETPVSPGSEGGVLVLAEDSSMRDEMIKRAESNNVRWTVFGTKNVLGRLMGRAELGVLVILERGIADEVAATAALVSELSEAE